MNPTTAPSLAKADSEQLGLTPSDLSEIRRALIWIWITPLGPHLIGSLFNILYNVHHVHPLLVGNQAQLFHQSILIANVLVYPLGVWAWWSAVQRVLRAARASSNGCAATGAAAAEWAPPEAQQRARQRAQLRAAQRAAIHLPFALTGISASSWLACIPIILFGLHQSSTPVSPHVDVHFAISISIGAVTALAHSFFAIELVSQQWLYPKLFVDIQPYEVPESWTLSLRQRGVLWAIAAGICPICCLTLLLIAPGGERRVNFWFGPAVAFVAAAFALITAGLLGQLITIPLHRLRRAARAVSQGDLNAHIDLRCADEFGPLITEFNRMLQGLREKQELQAAFGRHVGPVAAQQILLQDPTLAGTERHITVLFADIRNFTARSAQAPAQEVVELLNVFLTEMVAIIEHEHGGMVNKFLGDGLMALFGAVAPVGSATSSDTAGSSASAVPTDSAALTGPAVPIGPAAHPEQALRAGQAMLARLQELNQRYAAQGTEPLRIGIGIHSGPAIVGSIGSAGRGDYTAIGSTVNIAARVEALTKSLGVPLLITAATRAELSSTRELRELPPQHVKGYPEAIGLWTVMPSEAEIC